MSFYSYKNANSETSPGNVNGSVLNGLNKRVCIQVKNVYDSCLNQEQLDDKKVVISNIVPIVPGGDCRVSGSIGCNCSCEGNVCTCACDTCGAPITHDKAVENAETNPCPLPTPCGTWTFESCRSSTTKGRISNLSVERMCDRPQFARVKATVDVPIDVLFTDQRCQEWLGQACLKIDRDVLLCIPDDSIIPFTLESLVSAICVSGSYIGNCTFEITICVTIVLKVLAEVDIMVPTYGFCEVPPCEEFAEAVCDEFFSSCYRYLNSNQMLSRCILAKASIFVLVLTQTGICLSIKAYTRQFIVYPSVKDKRAVPYAPVKLVHLAVMNSANPDCRYIDIGHHFLLPKQRRSCRV